LPESGIKVLKHDRQLAVSQSGFQNRTLAILEERLYCMIAQASSVPVCVFAKPPLPGEVKTRLIGVLGEDGAAALASVMLRDVWVAVSSVTMARPVLASDKLGTFPVQLDKRDLWLQGEGDLGARMERIFIRALLSAPAALAIGADSPFLKASEVTQAIELMVTYDAVMGRSRDGGFYLLGLRTCWSGLFADIPWSCCETAEAMRRRLQEHGMTIAEIAPGFDVDTPSDLQHLIDELARRPDGAPETRTWMNGKRSPGVSVDAH
jgi:rSAM/selenodomain-associated transferase 1